MGDDFLHVQLIKLGDMMGDGLHHEEPWISKEYPRISKLLIKSDPELQEFYKKQRKIKNIARNEKLNELLSKNKCSCGGILRQTRSGALTVVCVICGLRYKAKKSKKQISK